MSNMVETRDHFAERLGKLGKKHQRMTHGYRTKVGADGLIVVTPKRRSLVPAGAGIKLLLLVVVGFFGFKAFALTASGPITYNERLAKLAEGSVVEQIGAKALAVDPITETIANKVTSWYAATLN